MEIVMKTPLSILLASLVIISGQAYAERPHRPHDPGVNARQHRQEHRVKQGVRSGELTRGETQQLREQRRAIRQEERAYKSDGQLSRDERKDLHQDLNALSKDIYSEKHDDEKRRKAQQ